MSREKYSLILEDSFMITPNVKHLVFKRADNTAPNFIPGQFVNVHFAMNDQSIQRSYSIATIAGTQPTIEIAIAYVEGGLATNYLFNLEKGKEIQCSGPFGRLVLKENEMPKRYVLIATGTGIAPYRAMLPVIKQKLQEHPESQVVVVLGVTKRQECLYHDDFYDLAQTQPNFSFQACYSREMPENSQPHEHQGRLLSILDNLEFQSEQDIVYLCGNPSMVDDVYHYLQNLGFGTQNVRREKYVFSH